MVMQVPFESTPTLKAYIGMQWKRSTWNHHWNYRLRKFVVQVLYSFSVISSYLNYMLKGEVTVLNEAPLCNMMKRDMDLWYIFCPVDSTDAQRPDDVSDV